MKKVYRITTFILMVAALAYPQEVSFKLLGGLTCIQGDDYNKAITGSLQLIHDTSSAVSGEYKKLKNGINLQGEIITHWGRRIAVGLGGGYFEIGNSSRVTIQAMAADGPFTSDSTFKPRLSVIPFYLNIYYKMRIASKVGLDLFVGPVFQIAQLSFERQEVSDLNSLTETETFKASSPSLGLQAGIGLNIKLSGGISFITDTFWRSTKVSNLTGNWAWNSSSASGAVSQSSSEYYYWYYNYSAGKTYAQIGFFDKNGPSAEGISDVRKADINLSGFTAVAGVKIDF